jgi:hypothetical protein
LTFDKSISNQGLERIILRVGDDGFRQPDYGHGCTLAIREGWNSSCEFLAAYLSLNELHDLRYLIDEALRRQG